MRTYRSLTLAELKELVEDAIYEHGAHTLTGFSCNYGDYSRTMQLLPFTTYMVQLQGVEESAYSQSGFAIQPLDPICPECENEKVTEREGLYICPECGTTWREEERMKVAAFIFDRL